ncbi:Rhs element Vgr protein [Caballeronia novacaledonica]|uniref:Rhs element Vgr protein n=2 Tax=Caballeronia novacaledonica TaxID=1544861 RepID=A0A2U3I4R2_9BURK|nr:Rhs element Vgr protein [Caballeronia novacaledonica]
MPGPYSIRLDAYDEYWLRNFDEIEYIVKAVSGEVIKTGTLDKHGRTDRIFTEAAEELDVLVGTTGGWLVESEDAESSHPTTVTVAEHLLGEDNNHYVNREYEILS